MTEKTEMLRDRLVAVLIDTQRFYPSGFLFWLLASAVSLLRQVNCMNPGFVDNLRMLGVLGLIIVFAIFGVFFGGGGHASRIFGAMSPA